MNSAHSYTEGYEIDVTEDNFLIIKTMSKNLKGASKYIQKEIDEQKNIVIIETLKESSAKEKRERAEKQIEKLEAQLADLSPGAFATL